MLKVDWLLVFLIQKLEKLREKYQILVVLWLLLFLTQKIDNLTKKTDANILVKRTDYNENISDWGRIVWKFKSEIAKP